MGQALRSDSKTFEFAVAAGIRINGSLPVKVASEKDSSQNTPDVLISGGFSIQRVACKVVTGKHIQTVIDNISKGALQISKSQANVGLVALDVRHRIDEELLIPRIVGDKYRTFTDCQAARDQIRNVLSELADEILASISKKWRVQYYEWTRCHAFLLTAQSCALIETADGPVPTLVGHNTVVPVVEGGDLQDALNVGTWIGGSVAVTG